MHLEDLAHWEVRNNGKSITEAKADILQCADTFGWFFQLVFGKTVFGPFRISFYAGI
jgi:acyl-CoA reductase-like NAD-dependent aldehyde dehydrogenase